MIRLQRVNTGHRRDHFLRQILTSIFLSVKEEYPGDNF